jgi:hypothetical protein
MALSDGEKEYATQLVALLRSDHPLDDHSTFRFLGQGWRPGLSRLERDAIADILEYFFRRKDGKKQGRPPDTIFDKSASFVRLLRYQRLVFSELSGGKSYPEAVKNVARKVGLRTSTLKNYLRRIKGESELQTDEEQASFAKRSEQLEHLRLVQDEISAKKPYDDAVRIVAKRKRIDPSTLKRITKPFFEE